jgi:hypothetical protein
VKNYRLQEANHNTFLQPKNTELSWSALLYVKDVIRQPAEDGDPAAWLDVRLGLMFLGNRDSTT